MKNFIHRAAALTLSLLLVFFCAVPAGATTIDVTDFTVDDSAEDKIVVTWADSADAVLKNTAAEGRTAEMTIDCKFDEAYALYVTGSKVVPSTIHDGKITFEIPGAGVYHILKGEPPVTNYTVTFSSDGGSTVESQSIAEGGKLTKPADPTRKGYTFSGWYTDAALTDAWDFSADTVTGNITLYAKWTKIPVKEENDPTTEPTTEPETEPASTITKVEISPEKVTLKKGGSRRFTAKVSGTGDFDDSVIWSVSGNRDSATKISSDGKLVIGENETARKLTVTARSKQDPTRLATATVKIQRSAFNPSTGDYILLAAATAAVSGCALAALLLVKKGKKKTW